MYSLPDYGRMLGEKYRFTAYRRALERAVLPGDVVIDLGSGPGVFALLAARAGASKVFAVEPDPVVELVARLAQANDLPQIIPIPSLSKTFEPEAKADVLISDLRGVLPTFTEHIPSIIDARDRLLARGGLLIPHRDSLWAAPIVAPQARRRHLGGFGDVEGLDLSMASRQASHLWTRVELESEALASSPEKLGEIDYRHVDSPNFKATATFALEASQLDGIAVWFDAEIDGEEHFSNAPSSKLIYGQAFFPFEHVIQARAGDRLELRFGAYYMPGDDYLYRWAGRLERAGKEMARFDQSSFHGTSVASSSVAARSPGHIPRPSEETQIDSMILGSLDGESSLGEIAERVERRFPNAVGDRHGALRRVSAIVDRYGG